MDYRQQSLETRSTGEYRSVNQPEELWNRTAAHVRPLVADAVWQSTFAHATGVEIDDESFTLGVPNGFAKTRVEERYRDLVLNALAEAGAPNLELKTIVIDLRDSAQVVLELNDTPADAATDGVATLATGAAGSPAPLNDTGRPVARSEGGAATSTNKYTFEWFVTGASNRFAHAAALSVAETPGKSYNPLFIYGDAGLGKTHLLRSIAHYVGEHYPNFLVRYVSTEAFLNEFVNAIRTNDQAGFKQRYREVDVLLIDDIQFVENKEGLQEELFHTFNTLHEADRQIIISSDRPPDAISTLEDRLRSRFKWGLITDIQPPDVETRLAILYKKAEAQPGVPIPDDVLRFIASNISNNIRELEGALVRVQAWVSLNKAAITLEDAERALSDIVSKEQPKRITPADILDATVEMFGFTEEELKGRSRRRPLVTARQISMYVFRELTDLSYPQIAREFGGRDHTTVIHAVEKITTQMGERHQIYDQVTELVRVVKGDQR